MEQHYLLPGDTLKSNSENMHFHKDFIYSVSKCLNSKQGLRIFIKDKNGFDVPISNMQYEYTTKTVTEVDKRILQVKLSYIWNNPCEFSNLYSTDKYKFNLRKAYFLQNPEAKAYLEYSNDINSNSVYLSGEQEFIDFMVKNKNLLGDPGRIYVDNNTPTWVIKEQDTLFNLLFIQNNEFEIYKEDKVNLPETLYSNYEIKKYDSFNEYIESMSLLIFDKPKINQNIEFELMRDIIILYRDLPSSHSATSVSKILAGKSKVKNSNIDKYFGKYSTYMKQVQLFELASHINQYLYDTKIVKTKDSYASGNEDRGAFEFIGSKYINTIELNKLISILNNSII